MEVEDDLLADGLCVCVGVCVCGVRQRQQRRTGVGGDNSTRAHTAFVGKALRVAHALGGAVSPAVDSGFFR